MILRVWVSAILCGATGCSTIVAPDRVTVDAVADGPNMEERSEMPDGGSTEAACYRAVALPCYSDEECSRRFSAGNGTSYSLCTHPYPGSCVAADHCVDPNKRRPACAGTSLCVRPATLNSVRCIAPPTRQVAFRTAAASTPLTNSDRTPRWCSRDRVDRPRA